MNDSQPSLPVFGRRTFLLGTAAFGALGACSGSDDASTKATNEVGETTEPIVADEYQGSSADLAEGSFSIIQRFPADVQIPGAIRLPFSLSSAKAQFVSDGPLTLGAQIVDLDGQPIGARIEAARHDVTPGSYYPFRTEITEPGFYGIVIDGGPATGANFQVVEASAVSLPKPGDQLVGFDTPTVGAPGDVDPICTRDPVCPFHSVTLAEALTVGKPVVYLAGTPAFCQTGSCAPALEALIDSEEEFGDAYVMLHTEVYTDLTATALAPAFEALDMLFEPALFITDADGTIVERLDGLWDTAELVERLTAARA